MKSYVSPRAMIEEGVHLGSGVRILGQAKIGRGTFIDDFSVIGHPYSEEIEEFMREGFSRGEYLDDFVVKPTKIGENCQIDRGSIISAGSLIGGGSKFEFEVFIGTDTTIGEGARLVYRAQVYNDVNIGDNCIIGGFVGDSSILRDNVRMLGNLIHAHKVPIKDRPGWDEIRETGPFVKNGAIVGFGATVIGKKIIGENAYVLSGAVVTKDVAPGDIVAGIPAVSVKDKVNLG